MENQDLKPWTWDTIKEVFHAESHQWWALGQLDRINTWFSNDIIYPHAQMLDKYDIPPRENWRYLCVRHWLTSLVQSLGPPRSTWFSMVCKNLPLTRGNKKIKSLIKFKPLFPQYDTKIDVLSNMSSFESSVKQYMLSPKEACVMLKLWLPGGLASRLEAPVSGPNDINKEWFKEDKWVTEGDRLRAVSRLVTGNRDLDSHSLAEMRVTIQDDPWVFASKFEQVYRLTHRVSPDQTPSDMLQYLVRKCTYLDPSIQMMAEEKDTMEAVLCIIDKARQNILRKGVTGPHKIAVVTTNEGKPNPLEISFKGICNYCNKPGHRFRDCRRWMREHKQGEGWQAHQHTLGSSKDRIDEKGAFRQNEPKPPDKTGKEYAPKTMPGNNLYGPAQEALRKMIAGIERNQERQFENNSSLTSLSD
ncbi:uncharacterized protein O3C94_014398 [Discoglossus pictus]